MLNSMTAFSRIQSEFAEGTLCWEIRSVNHRYLESSFRLPENFRFLETALRTILRNEIQRGKIECQLKYSEQSTDSNLKINHLLINTLIKTAEQIASEHQLANDLTVNKLLDWPGVIEVTQSPTEDIAQFMQDSFTKALKELQNARGREGQVLKEFILKRLSRLKEIIASVRSQINGISTEIKDKLLTRLKDIHVEVDETRMEQEIALILTRLDITEEIDRIELHAVEVERNLESQEPVGRRLDFLMQELNREANTLSSKSESIALIQAGVEMKVLIEQMREQIQNIE